MVIQHGLNTLRAGEKHELQPALIIHWAQSLRQTVPTHMLPGIVFIQKFISCQFCKTSQF